ncbi:hypothetical protein MRX96_002255 [Rhipicephalus microplus]
MLAWMSAALAVELPTANRYQHGKAVIGTVGASPRWLLPPVQVRWKTLRLQSNYVLLFLHGLLWLLCTMGQGQYLRVVKEAVAGEHIVASIGLEMAASAELGGSPERGLSTACGLVACICGLGKVKWSPTTMEAKASAIRNRIGGARAGGLADLITDQYGTAASRKT